MYLENSKDCNSSTDSTHTPLIDDTSNKFQRMEQDSSTNDENTQILIDSNNDEDLSSSEANEEEEEEKDNEDEENSPAGNYFEKNTILQSLNQSNCSNTLNNLLSRTPNANVTFNQSENIVETIQMNNDSMHAQTMTILAAKYQPTKSINHTPSRSEILSFIGPCPLYSLASSFGLDMYHGHSNFPCRDIFAGGRGSKLGSPLWQHLTLSHNLNLSSSSIIISRLLLHGYSSPSPILFNSQTIKNVLRTTPRYSLIKRCPLTNYGVYGIHCEHGARLCSGYTYNTNIFSHLISFHKMTNNASLRLSRAIAFNNKQFKFEFNETIVSEYVKCPLQKPCQVKRISRPINYKFHLCKKIIQNKPVKNS
ncbi:unnamed protein product [Rotaria magnacalcarata]|uniref:Uncharacterized protein n=1 Tax=Rotaria magnacalcarata TaxID=392030 RepID=A0A816HDG7_9BILA|nr:unnamed protein product [Rotaria magnacalcarata]CAF3912067.1 unnamed protein product [Rotaria magnacalcarata]